MNIDYIPERNIFFAMLKVVGKAFFFSFQSLRVLFSDGKKFLSKGRIVFFSISENNHLSVNPVYVKLPAGSANSFGDRMYNKQVVLFLPTVFSAIVAFVFFPKVVYDYCISSKMERRGFRKGINDIVLSYPFYYISYLWFKIVRPKAIVISNDHVFSTRMLVHWANKFNVPSFYLQHASVTKDFPPLEVKYALLEGLDAKEKYELAGSDSSKVELIGMPKMDYAFKKINSSKTVNAIGVAVNGLEPKQQVLDLLVSLGSDFPDLKIVFRPHRMQYFDSKNKADLEFIKRNIPASILLSNPFEESATDYLASLDMLIAGDSSIHLEAVLMNVTALYSFSGNYTDYYGFVKNGLVKQVTTLQELKEFIDSEKNIRQDVRYKAKRYCDTVGTEYDGRSAELAVKLMMEKV
jgi:hypothetical protein